MLCNVVYAHLTAGMGPQAREAFDAELYAPAGGWEQAEADMWRRIDEAAAEQAVAEQEG